MRHRGSHPEGDACTADWEQWFGADTGDWREEGSLASWVQQDNHAEARQTLMSREMGRENILRANHLGLHATGTLLVCLTTETTHLADSMATSSDSRTRADLPAGVEGSVGDEC